MDYNEEFEEIADRENISYAIGWLLDQVKYKVDEIQKLTKQRNLLKEACESELKRCGGVVPILVKALKQCEG